MSCKLYANIGIGHENDIDLLEKRLINAAQCNADAVILNRSTPRVVIPENKKYVSIQSKWGSLPYLEVANKSELSPSNMERITDTAKKIGIPIIWSTTDTEAAELIKEHTDCTTIKLHKDTVDIYECSRYCINNFSHVIYNLDHLPEVEVLYKRKQDYSLYYTTTNFPPQNNELEFSQMYPFIFRNIKTGYEGREAGIFPALALVYYGVDYIEKYLGDDDSDNPSVLTPAQFYDLFNSMNILEESL